MPKLPIATLVLLAAAAVPAAASPDNNVLTLLEGGTLNVVHVVQSAQSAHRATIATAGHGNGAGLVGAWHQPGDLLGASALAPGGLVQEGLQHALTLTVEGQSNLFAARQSGASHVLTGTIVGQSNQALVTQSGTGQTAVFQQSGARNSLSIHQGSW